MELPDRSRPPAINYGDYLRLETLLDAQHLESKKYGPPAHDEMLFIITHQAYELWFKQIVYELASVIEVFQSPPVQEYRMGRVIHQLERIKVIQTVLLQQIDVIETMTPLDFLEFRDLLVPASGFQSIQFKQIEIMLGVKRAQRIPADQDFFFSRLKEDQRQSLEALEALPSLLDLTIAWLSRIPFLKFAGFDFWQEYANATQKMLQSDRQIIQGNPDLSASQRSVQLAANQSTEQRFEAILDFDQYQALQKQGEFRFSHDAFLASLFIHLYRDQPMLQLPFRYLTLLVDIDENMTTWRSRHALMVQRMLGRRIGTGGSSGHDYLNQTTQKNRVFLDLYALSTFLLPRSALPVLPEKLVSALGFHFSGAGRSV